MISVVRVTREQQVLERDLIIQAEAEGLSLVRIREIPRKPGDRGQIRLRGHRLRLVHVFVVEEEE